MHGARIQKDLIRVTVMNLYFMEMDSIAIITILASFIHVMIFRIVLSMTTILMASVVHAISKRMAG